MKRALYISFQDFREAHDGGSLANKRNVDIAQQILGDENVDCFFVNEKKKRSIMALLYTAILFLFGYFNGLTPRKVQTIIEISANYDYVFINTSLFGIVAKKLKEAGYKGRVIAFFHNVESVYYDARVSKRVPFRNVVINCASQNDNYSLSYSDISVGLCERDSEIMKKLYGREFDVLAPITFADRCTRGQHDVSQLTGIRPKCYFIGSNFPANAEGILWFVKNVLPYVDIDFKIIGKDMDKLQRDNPVLADIAVYSNVPDLAPFFDEADFMVFPIFSGSGMKVKTCEALMYGKNILGTTETFEGYDLNVSSCGRLCNSADDYIESIKYFSDNPVPRYNEYSRSVYKEKYSNSSSLDTFKKIFR